MARPADRLARESNRNALGPRLPIKKIAIARMALLNRRTIELAPRVGAEPTTCVAVPTSAWRLSWRESIIIWMHIRLWRAAWLFPLVLIASGEKTSPASTITTAPNPQFKQHTVSSRNVGAPLALRL